MRVSPYEPPWLCSALHEYSSRVTSGSKPKWREYRSRRIGERNTSEGKYLAAAAVDVPVDLTRFYAGTGDVALMAAEMVGPEGRVVGVDQNPEVLKTARTRAQAAGATNVTFLEGNIPDAVMEEEGFDAVVGRLVLMYLPNPVEALGQLIRKVRPGGIAAFQDFDQTPRSLVAHPSMPLWERFFGWVTAVAQTAPVDEQMGYKLFESYLEVGLPAPKMEVNSPVGGGPNWEGYEYAAETLRSMMPLVLKFGIATAEEVEIETLADRLRAESVAYQGVVKPPEMVSAWAIKP